MEMNLPKGTRDIFFEDEIMREDVVEKIKTVFIKHGFNPMETPIFEKLEVLSAKYAGGGEILKETFKLKDQGKRELALRYDLTVPLARFLSNNKVKMPFKRFQVGPVFRDGPIKLGRYRQFTQCDADIVGIKNMNAEIEILNLIFDVFKILKLDVEIRINSRKLLDGILDYAGIGRSKRMQVILILDKLSKIGESKVMSELEELKIDERQVRRILDIVSIKGTNKQVLDKIEKFLPYNKGLSELREVEKEFKKVKIDASMARGLVYYTGTVIEVYAKKGKIQSSLAAGGRYDDMIEKYIGIDFPSVGVSFGLDVIMDVLKLNNYKSEKNLVKAYIVPIKTLSQSFILAKKLRDKNISVDLDMNYRSISKNLDYANRYGIPFVIILGERELKLSKFKLKDMRSGKEKLVNLSTLVKILS